MLIRACLFEISAVLPISVAANPNGSALYAEHCAGCHRLNLEGEESWRVQNADGTLPAPPHDDSGHTWHHPDAMLRAYVRLGGQEALRQMGVTGVASAMSGFGNI